MRWQKGTIILKTVSPVFIGAGDGREIKKTEYYLNRREGKAYILNTSKFFRFLMKKNLQNSYQDYILKSEKHSLSNWLLEHKEQISYKDIMSFCDYSLDIGDIDIRYSTIKSFVKDSYGEPYIPGCSLKGAIRTVVLHSLLKDNNSCNVFRGNINSQLFDKNYRFKKTIFLKEEAGTIEALLQTKEKNGSDLITHKWMTGLRISDSHVIPKTNLCLCAKEDYSANGRMAVSKIPVLRECLKPGTEVQFSFLIDKDKFPYSIEDIASMIHIFFQDYEKKYLNSFGRKIEYPECVLCLGGGVGYVSKTLTYSLYQKEEAIKVSRTILEKQFPKHKHCQDSKISPRMRKMTHYNNTLYDMGLCAFSYKNERFLSAP